MKSLKRVYKNLMSEQFSVSSGFSDLHDLDVNSNTAALNSDTVKNSLDDSSYLDNSVVDARFGKGLTLSDDLIAENFYDLFCRAVEDVVADTNNYYETTVNFIESDYSTKSFKQKFSFEEMINYIYYLVLIGEISTQDFTKISINESIEIESLKALLFSDDPGKSKTHIVSNVINSNSLNDFKANFFYFLYKKLYDQSAKLKLKTNADLSKLKLNVENGFISLFDQLLKDNQSAFTVNLGTLFEEIFKAYAYAVILSNDDTTISYKDILENPGDYNIKINLAHLSKKISIVLIMACNKSFNNTSSVYKALNAGNKPSDDDYFNDLKNVIKIDDTSDSVLKSEIDKILGIYAKLIGISRSEMLCDDYESDDIFCPARDNKYTHVDTKFLSRLRSYKSNAPFDFIVRHKNYDNKSDQKIGLFDLKASNEGSKSSPLKIGSTGNNGGSENSALNFIKDIVTLGSEKNNDFNLAFFGLIEIEYKLDFESGNNKDIIVNNVRHKIASCGASVRYSNGNDKFYLAKNTDANTQTKIDIESSKNIDDYNGDNIKLFSDDALKKDSNALNFETIKREKIRGYENLVIEKLKSIYSNNNNVLDAIKKHNLDYKALYFDANYIQALVNILDKINNSDSNVEALGQTIINKINADELMKIENIPCVAEGFLAYFVNIRYPNIVTDDFSEHSKAVKDALNEHYTSGLENAKSSRPSFRRYITNSIVSTWSDINFDQNVYINANKFTKDLKKYIHDKTSLDAEAIKIYNAEADTSSQPNLGSILDLSSEVYVKNIRNFIIKKINDIVSSANVNNNDTDQHESYSHSKKTLVEVYSSLFKKKLIVEGGLGGHMMHPYEMLDSTPREMINQIKRYSLPQTIVEKVDGQNLFFTVERDGTLLFARNKEDMTHDDLIDKFKGHGAEKAFVEGGNAIKSGVEQGLTGREEEVTAIFHPSEDVRSFINFEIMHPEKPNQFRYDQKYIVFHSIVDYKEGRVQVGSSSTDERIARLINLIRSGIESSGFILASNQTVDLNSLEDVQISEYKDRIMDASSALRISDDQTFADGIMNMISDELQAEGVVISDEALSILRDYVIYGEDASGRKIHSKEFTKIISKKDAAKLRSLGLTTSTKVMSKIGKILMPFKDIFVDLGIDLLKGVKSSYMSDDNHQQNIEDIKDKLQTAINDIDRYTSEVAEENWSNVIIRLMPHVRKVKQKGIENIVASSVEGGVYSHDDNLMKLTGGFAPMNQIVGAAYRDNEGIFTEFNSKFKKIESVKRSLKGVFSLIF
jgi:hypothetical protein